MNYFLILILSGISCLSYSQNRYPVLFQSRNSDGHSITVPGTRVSLIPPEKFELGRTFTGLKNGSSLIEVYDLPGGAYKTISADFTAAKFTTQGLRVFGLEEVRIDGYEGRLISLRNHDGQNSFSLVFGDENFSVIIVANYPATDGPLGEVIRTALLGVEYDEAEKRNALSSAAFRLNDARSPFKFEKRAADTFYFELPDSDGEKRPYVTVTQLAWDYATSPETIGELMLAEMSKHGLSNPDIKRKSYRAINGYRASESEIYASRKGEKYLVYQVVMVNDSRVLVFHGIGNSDFKKNRIAFRRAARSLTFR